MLLGSLRELSCCLVCQDAARTPPLVSCVSRLGPFSHQSCRGIFERFRLCACEALLRQSSRARHGHCIPLMAVAPLNRATATGPSAVEPIGETPFSNALGRATETTVRARASIRPQEHNRRVPRLCGAGPLRNEYQRACLRRQAPPPRQRRRGGGRPPPPLAGRGPRTAAVKSE